MFLASQLYFSMKQDVITQEVVEQETRQLSNTICEHGEITQTNLAIYLKTIASTGNLYDVSILHEKLCFEPEYRFKTSEEIINDQNNSYTGPNQYTYQEVISNKPSVDDSQPTDLVMNTETNESVIANSTSTPSIAEHVHSDACYAGTKHIHSGSSSLGTGCYTKYVAGSSYTCGSVSFDRSTGTYNTTCSRCGRATVGTYYEGTCSGCGQTCSAGSRVSCSSCGYSMVYVGGHTISSSSHYDMNCGKTEEKYYDSSGAEVSTCCGQVIVSITPTHPVQNIYNGDRIITTSTVTYLDGSTNVVICSSSFNTNQLGYGQTATLTYYGLISATTRQTFTTTITVNVFASTTTCSNDHTYWLAVDGSDPGCPYCRAWLRYLSIVSPTTGHLEIYQGTSLESNGVVVLATYLDGRQEYISTGYAHNLDNVYIGTQTVTIGYKGKFVTLQVKVLRRRKQCTICNRFYELYPDGSDPSCPYCLALVPVFTGNVMKYYTESTSDEISEEINAHGYYLLSEGDEIRIQVSNKTETLASRILSFFGIRSSNTIKVWIVNEVRDEK